MEVMVARGAGLDVAKKSVVVCVLAGEPGTVVVPEIKTFGTMTADLERLAGWLAERGGTDVLMEATRSSWKPSSNVLEWHGGFRLVVGNAEHLKAVPGRKTDGKDAVWLAQLLRHGPVRPSFIPDQEQREPRELTRYRTALIRERAREVNRLQKTLEAANIKLAAVISDVTGVSGQAILDALVNGEEDPSALADLAHWRVQQKREALEPSLVGQLSPLLTFVVKQQLRHIRELDDLIATCDAEVEDRMRPFAEAIARRDEIPGMGTRTAQVIVAELGVDMTRFPSSRHAAAWAAGRCKGSYLPEHFRRLAARRGKKRAIVAVGHSILVIAYHRLDRGTSYQDLGPEHFDRRDADRVTRRSVKRLESLGYKVTIERQEDAA